MFLEDFNLYVEKQWESRKYLLLNEALEKTEAKYAGGGASPRIPILYKQEDWFYLTQFEPAVWGAALWWRYNTGLVEASAKRDELLREKELELAQAKIHINSPEWRDAVKKLYAELSKFNNTFTISFPMSAGYYHVYGNQNNRQLYTGVWDLLSRLEKPIKYHAEHEIKQSDNPYAVETPEGPGLYDIDLITDDDMAKIDDEEKRTRMKKSRAGLVPRSQYQGGYHGLDLTKPDTVPEALIMAIQDPENELVRDLVQDMLRNGEADTPEKALIKAKKKLIDFPFVSFAGSPALRSEAAKDTLKTWIMSQCAGMLGTPSVGQTLTSSDGRSFTVEDVIQGKDKVAQKMREINSKWTSFATSLPETFGDGYEPTLPITSIKVSYTIYDNRGYLQSEVKNKTFTVPVLLDGKLLPTIKMTPEQTEKLVERRRLTREAKSGEGTSTSRRKDTQIGDIQQLLMNLDLLAPPQVEKLRHSRISELDIATRKYIGGTEYFDRFEDVNDVIPGNARYLTLKDAEQYILDNPESDFKVEQTPEGDYQIRVRSARSGVGEDYYVAGGWHVNKNQRDRVDINMSLEQLEKAYRDYLPHTSEKLKIETDLWADQPYINAYNQSEDVGVSGHEGNVSGCTGMNGLYGEACRGVSQYLNYLLKEGGVKLRARKVSDSEAESANKKNQNLMIYQMLSSVFPEVVSVAATLLLLELNHPLRGIYRPDDGLHAVNPKMRTKTGEEWSQVLRMSYAYNFARDMGQAALADGKDEETAALPSRRRRVGLGSEEGYGGEKAAEGSVIGKIDIPEERRRVWYLPKPGEVARKIWTLPAYGKHLKNFFSTKKAEVQKYIDSRIHTNLSAVFDILEKKTEFYVNKMAEMFIEARADLGDSFDEMSDEDRRTWVEAKTKEIEDKIIADIQAEHPELAGDQFKGEITQRLGETVRTLAHKYNNLTEHVPLTAPPLNLPVEDFQQLKSDNIEAMKEIFLKGGSSDISAVLLLNVGDNYYYWGIQNFFTFPQDVMTFISTYILNRLPGEEPATHEGQEEWYDVIDPKSAKYYPQIDGINLSSVTEFDINSIGTLIKSLVGIGDIKDIHSALQKFLHCIGLDKSDCKDFIISALMNVCGFSQNNAILLATQQWNIPTYVIGKYLSTIKSQPKATNPLESLTTYIKKPDMRPQIALAEIKRLAAPVDKKDLEDLLTQLPSMSLPSWTLPVVTKGIKDAINEKS